jgi:hypothetical protein
MVTGSVVMARGRVMTVEVPALRDAIRAHRPAMAAVVRATAEAVVRLQPFYADMARRTAPVDVGFTQWGSATP